MKRYAVVLAVSFVSFLAGLIAARPINTAAHIGYLGQFPRSLSQLLFPKGDLYTLIILGPVDVAQTGGRYAYTFSHRYAGRHVFGLLAGKHIDVTEFSAEQPCPRLSISCSSVDLHPQAIRLHPPSPWSSWEHQEGFIIAWYDVPRTLPIRQEIDCNLIVEQGDRSFADRYGVYALFSKKISEIRLMAGLTTP